MDFILSQNGLSTPVVEAQKYFGAGYNKFLDKMTIKTKMKIGPMKVAKMFKTEWIEATINLGGKQTKRKLQILHIPRFYLKNIASAVAKIDVVLPPGRILSDEAAQFDAELENNQNVVVDNLMNNVFTPENIKAGTAGCTLNLGAGRGKTFIAAGIIARLKRSALYFLPNTSILLQTIEAMSICFPNANIKYYSDLKDEAKKQAKKELNAERKKLNAAKKEEPGENTPAAISEPPPTTAAINERAELIFARMVAGVDICIIVINSAMMASEQFFANFGIMIFDEVHEYCGKERSKVFWSCQAPVMLGLSATTDEHLFGWDKIYYKQVGDVVFAKEMPGYDPTEVKFTGSVKIIKYHGPPGFTRNIQNESTGMVSTAEMHKQAMNDTCRNMLLICETLAIYMDKSCERNIFMFFELRDYVDLIVRMLRNENVIRLALKILANSNKDDADAAADAAAAAANIVIGDVFAPEVDMMKGSSKQDELERASKSRIIVTTYGYSKTGVSIIRMNSLVIGTSRKSKFKQTLARVMRLRSDYSIERKFIDIVDWETSLVRQHYDRRKAFVFYEFAMESVDVSWEDYKEILELPGVEDL